MRCTLISSPALMPLIMHGQSRLRCGSLWNRRSGSPALRHQRASSRMRRAATNKQAILWIAHSVGTWAHHRSALPQDTLRGLRRLADMAKLQRLQTDDPAIADLVGIASLEYK